MSPAEHLSLLAVIIPLLAAPLCVLVERARAAWLIALSAGWLGLAAAAALLLRVMHEGTVSYHLGGWAPPWGIELRVDLLGAYVLLIVCAIAAVVLLYARRSVTREIPPSRIPGFYAAFLLAYAGLAGITVTGDAFNLFVFLEISSLSSYALISMGRDRRALSAAFQYLVMGSIGATFILIGIGFLYLMTGTLNMQDLAARLPAVADTRTVRAGFAFLTVGIGLKLAMFPLHLWLPNAYAYAPSVVSALLSATATKVAVYALLRFLLGVFGADFALGAMPLDGLLILLGAVGILSASLVALFQDNVKRMLAYSTISQLGYIVLGAMLGTAAGVVGGGMHIAMHAFGKITLFFCAGAILVAAHKTRVSELDGLGRQMPLTMLAFSVGALSIVGLPPFGGSWSKWLLVQGTLDAGLWLLTAVLLLSSLLNILYLLVIPLRGFFATPADGHTGLREAPPASLLAMGVTTAGCLLLFFYADPVYRLAGGMLQ